MRCSSLSVALVPLLLAAATLGCTHQGQCETQTPAPTAEATGLRTTVVDWIPDENYEPYEQAKLHEVEPPEEDPYAELSEDERTEQARVLFEEAEALAAEQQWLEAKTKYEQAYHLVPGKHGLALKVGMAAIEVGDCAKAKAFLEHFIVYGDLERQEPLILDALRAHRGLSCWHN